MGWVHPWVGLVWVGSGRVGSNFRARVMGWVRLGQSVFFYLHIFVSNVRNVKRASNSRRSIRNAIIDCTSLGHRRKQASYCIASTEQVPLKF